MVRELDLRLLATPTVKLPNVGLGNLSALDDSQRKIVHSLASVALRRQYVREARSLSDGSFPIPDVVHLKKAVLAYTFAENRPRAKRFIIRRARALSRTDLLPAAWGVAPSNPAALVADGGPENGIMIAIFPPPEMAELLAGEQDGDNPPDEMHVTLCYLGTTDDVTPEQLNAARQAIANVAIGQSPFDASVQGVGTFHAPESDDPQWYSVDAPGLAALRTGLVEALESVGVDVRAEHDFTPHMTVRYGGDQPELPDDGDEPWPVDAIVLACGPQRQVFPLGHGFVPNADDPDDDGDIDNVSNGPIFGLFDDEDANDVADADFCVLCAQPMLAVIHQQPPLPLWLDVMDNPGLATRVSELVNMIGEKVEFVAAPGPCSLDHSSKHNWVEQHGGLPNYICQVARAIARNGKSLESAIPIAIGTMKHWAAGGNSGGKPVSKAVQARAASAVAEWEKMKAAAGSEHAVDGAGEFLHWHHGWIPADAEARAIVKKGKDEQKAARLAAHRAKNASKDDARRARLIAHQNATAAKDDAKRQRLTTHRNVKGYSVLDLEVAETEFIYNPAEKRAPGGQFAPGKVTNGQSPTDKQALALLKVLGALPADQREAFLGKVKPDLLKSMQKHAGGAGTDRQTIGWINAAVAKLPVKKGAKAKKAAAPKAAPLPPAPVAKPLLGTPDQKIAAAQDNAKQAHAYAGQMQKIAADAAAKAQADPTPQNQAAATSAAQAAQRAQYAAERADATVASQQQAKSNAATTAQKSAQSAAQKTAAQQAALAAPQAPIAKPLIGTPDQKVATAQDNAKAASDYAAAVQKQADAATAKAAQSKNPADELAAQKAQASATRAQYASQRADATVAAQQLAAQKAAAAGAPKTSSGGSTSGSKPTSGGSTSIPATPSTPTTPAAPPTPPPAPMSADQQQKALDQQVSKASGTPVTLPPEATQSTGPASQHTPTPTDPQTPVDNASSGSTPTNFHPNTAAKAATNPNPQQSSGVGHMEAAVAEFAWNPDIHPSDKHGRPITQGAKVKHPQGEGKVVGNAPARDKQVVQVSGAPNGNVSVPPDQTEITDPENAKSLDDGPLKARHAAISADIATHLGKLASDAQKQAEKPGTSPDHPDAQAEVERLTEKRQPYADEIAKRNGATAGDPSVTASGFTDGDAENYTYYWNPDSSETFRVDEQGGVSVFAPRTDDQEEATWQQVDTLNGATDLADIQRLPQISDHVTLEAILGSSFTTLTADATEAAPEAPEAVPGEDTTGRRFRIPILIPEGVPTGDRRIFAEGALEAKECPMPLLWQRETDEGHKKSIIVGRIDKISRLESGGLGDAEGVFDTHPDAVEAARQVRNRFLTGVSGDVDQFEHELSQNDDGDERMLIKHGRLVAATLVAKPAFQEASIEMIPEEGESPVITASAGPLLPPKAWFFKPSLDGPTQLTVTDEGRVYGHIAEWGTPHMGNPQLKPPRSRQNYRYFNRKPLRVAEGEDIKVGNLTLIGGHAKLSYDPDRAVKHYDDTQSAVADVVAGEDEFGIWVAGAMRPDVTPTQVRAFRASEPSGDWRMRDGALELCAICQVNVPGFPVTPRALIASGEVVSLVAAGMVGRERKQLSLHETIAELQAQVAELAAERQAERRTKLLEAVQSLRQ